MGRTNKVAGLRDKLADRFGRMMDKVLGDQPDAAAARARAKQHEHEMPMSKADAASSGFPPELR
jgi:hypothetical protein